MDNIGFYPGCNKHADKNIFHHRKIFIPLISKITKNLQRYPNFDPLNNNNRHLIRGYRDIKKGLKRPDKGPLKPFNFRFRFVYYPSNISAMAIKNKRC